MFKKSLFGALALCFSVSTAAQAELTPDTAGMVILAGSNAAPPAGHKGQWWTHPRGCQYSRAGRPGETVWYLIVNTARRGCPPYIVTHTPYKDVY